MIRHSSSLLTSLLFHTILFALIFYTYKNIPLLNKQEDEKKICVKLSCFVEKKIPKKVAHVVIPKKPKPVIQKQKPIIKKKIKKKIPKKTKIVKEKIIIPTPIKEVIVPKKEIPKIVTQKKQIIENIVEDKTPHVDNKKVKKQILKQEYINNHIQEIVKLLGNNLYYPRSARKRGITGEVTVKFKLSTDAKVTFIEVIKSQNEILSRSAIKTIKDLSGKFPKPSESLTLEVPITYSLK